MIVGELRTPNLLNLTNAIKDFDIYISTYTNYKSLASSITENYLIDKESEIKKTILKNLAPNLQDRERVINNILQWWHLDNLLKNFKNILQSYDVILKIRSDSYFIFPLEEKMFRSINNKFLYINSDHIFYASSTKFYEIYSNFLEEIFNKYVGKPDTYFEINYKNLYESYKKRKPNPYLFMTFFSLHYIVRTGFDDPIEELIIPKELYNIDLDKRMENIRKFIINKKVLRNPKNAIATYPSGIPCFGSEKYHFLHAINNSVVHVSQLPTIGIFKRRINFIYKYIIFPVLKCVPEGKYKRDKIQPFSRNFTLLSKKFIRSIIFN